eukprot:6181394-Pleurochrysis_carterae.AAC.1
MEHPGDRLDIAEDLELFSLEMAIEVCAAPVDISFTNSEFGYMLCARLRKATAFLHSNDVLNECCMPRVLALNTRALPCAAALSPSPQLPALRPSCRRLPLERPASPLRCRGVPCRVWLRRSRAAARCRRCSTARSQSRL